MKFGGIISRDATPNSGGNHETSAVHHQWRFICVHEPHQVSLIQPYTEADGSIVTHIKTINASTTVTESLDTVVAKLIAEETPPIAVMVSHSET